MAIAKVLGIETEYGIAGGPEHDPITASSIVVNAYAQQGRSRINWDFQGETPDLDARGLPGLTSFAPIVETHLANTVLTNGARLYVDHAHPEYSSPECRTPLEAVALRRRRRVGAPARRWRVANASLDPAQAITLYKNNSDGKGNSYGCHENYLVDARRRVLRDRARDGAALRVAPDRRGRGQGRRRDRGRASRRRPAFQLSQRAEFFEEVVGLETTLKRPIINTRDEPHGDPERFRRLHVIVGDANMSQRGHPGQAGVDGPAPRACSRTAAPTSSRRRRATRCPRSARSRWTPRGAATATGDDGVARTAWDLQDQLWTLCERHVATAGADAVAPEAEVATILRHWREMLDGARDDPDAVADRVEWVGQAAPGRGLPGPLRPQPHRRPTARDRPAVPRPAPRALPGGPGRADAPGGGGRGS